MTTSIYRLAWSVAALSAAALIAGCNNDTAPQGSFSPTSTNASALAVTQILNKTCDTRTPDEINTVSFVSDDEVVDPAAVTPGCTPS